MATLNTPEATSRQGQGQPAFLPGQEPFLNQPSSAISTRSRSKSHGQADLHPPTSWSPTTQRPQSQRPSPKITIPSQNQHHHHPHRQHHPHPQAHHPSRNNMPHSSTPTRARHSTIGPHAISRTPRRDSSLPFPLPSVLPAMPALIPVSSTTSPTTPRRDNLTTLPSPTPSSTTTIPHECHDHGTLHLKNKASAASTSSSWTMASFTPAAPVHPAPIPPSPSTASTGTTTLGTSTETTPTTESWPEEPRQFLARVRETVSKAELGNVLSKGSDPFHQAVLRLHMESFDFRRDPIDLALRKFLLDFHFPKEAQQIDRVLEAFAGRYHACNPHLFRSADVVYTISFSLMLLHTDAHNKNVRYKMSKDQYVKQAKSIDGVNTIPADILEILFDNITFLKFVYAEDEMDVDGQRIADVQPQSGSWFPRRRTASNQRADSYSMIRHGSIAHLAPDLSDLIPFRWPYYWKGTIEMVDNVQINNQFTCAPLACIPGLRSRRHSHPQQTYQPNNKGFSPAFTNAGSMIHPEVLAKDHSRTFEETGWRMERTGPPSDGAAELKVAKYGILSRKIDLEQGRKSAVRSWRDLGVILSGSQLLFFTDLAWFQQQRATLTGFNPRAPPPVDGYFATELGNGPPPMPQALISTMDSIAVVDSSYQKYPHVFRLVCPGGKQYLFRTDSEHDMNDWMAKINYASAFKTAGVRLRNYRVSWASDVIWVKDDQGRHQLRRRRQTGSPAQHPPMDGRAELVLAKIKEIDKLIHTCSASLASELRLARGLEVMIPLQNTTRQKIVQSATVVGKRLRHLMLERTKLDCFRTVLERDLAVVAAPMWRDENSHAHGLGLDMNGYDAYSGSTAYSLPSHGSSTTFGTGADGTPGHRHSHSRSTQHHHQEWNRTQSLEYQSSASMDDHIDLAKEEYVLDSSRTSQASSRSFKGLPYPKLNLPEFHRSVSENALDDQRRHRSDSSVDFPQEPEAIQAAIIDAARGHTAGIHTTTSSPDPSLGQDKASCLSGSTGQASLSPQPSISPAVSRSRALSMPGQRPSRLPRTISIYSSSSQTASRLKRIFEQGLGHFKRQASSSSITPPMPAFDTLSRLEGASGNLVVAGQYQSPNATLMAPRIQEISNSDEKHPEAASDPESIILAVDPSTGSTFPVRPNDIVDPATSAAAILMAQSNSTSDREKSLDETDVGDELSAAATHSGNASQSLDTPTGMVPGCDPLSRAGSMDSNVDNGEDELTIDKGDVMLGHALSASETSLERSFVMMVKADYIQVDEDEDEDELDGLEVDVVQPSAVETAGKEEGGPAQRLETKDLNLSLRLDLPSLSILLDGEDAWHKIP